MVLCKINLVSNQHQTGQPNNYNKNMSSSEMLTTHNHIKFCIAWQLCHKHSSPYKELVYLFMKWLMIEPKIAKKKW